MTGEEREEVLGRRLLEDAPPLGRDSAMKIPGKQECARRESEGRFQGNIPLPALIIFMFPLRS